MHWVNALSTDGSGDDAVDEAVDGVCTALGGGSPDVAFVFAAGHPRPALRTMQARIAERLGGATIVGCAAAGVVGTGREVEEGPALSITAAELPGVTLAPFHFEPQEVPPPGTPTASWDARLGLPDEAGPSFLVFPDPMTCRTGDFIDALGSAYPAATVVGGMASGGNQPGEHMLLLGDRVHDSGVVGLALAGNVEVDSVVAQGCRPVGTPMFVTRGERNVVQELDGRTPAAVLQDLYGSLDDRDQRLMRTSLHLGVVMAESQEVYGPGDFLVRNILALDAQSGAMPVGAPIRTGQVVQFHLRDAETSAEDLDRLLAQYREAHDAPSGGLMFACLGRGKGLYGHPDHDAAAFARHCGGAALGGFFCNGEIGPVGGRTHLHGYTSAFALFRRRRAN